MLNIALPVDDDGLENPVDKYRWVIDPANVDYDMDQKQIRPPDHIRLGDSRYVFNFHMMGLFWREFLRRPNRGLMSKVNR